MTLGLLSACEIIALGAHAADNVGMGDIVIEQVGGFVGGGTPAGPLRMEGRVAESMLSAADKATVDALFAAHKPVNENLRYRLTRDGPSGRETVEAPMDAVPKVLRDSVQTTLQPPTPPPQRP